MGEKSRGYRWVLLVHQLPPHPSKLRVKVWRKLQRMGAVALRNSVYVLPYREHIYEEFLQLAQKIREKGGQVSVFRADTIDDMEDREIVQLFQEARGRDYREVLKALTELEGRLKSEAHEVESSAAGELQRLRLRIEDISRIDFFGAPERAAVLEAFRRCQRALGGVAPEASVPVHSREAFCGRTWVTRSPPYVDRVASAWLIRRFVDRRARFVFVGEGEEMEEGWVPFAMPGVEFGHHGEDCTFETIMKAFDLAEPVLRQIAEIVHDADLKDGKFGRPEADGVERAIKGLNIILSDAEVLEVGGRIFDGLAAALSVGS